VLLKLFQSSKVEVVRTKRLQRRRMLWRLLLLDEQERVDDEEGAAVAVFDPDHFMPPYPHMCPCRHVAHNSATTRSRLNSRTVSDQEEEEESVGTGGAESKQTRQRMIPPAVDTAAEATTLAVYDGGAGESQAYEAMRTKWGGFFGFWLEQ
jgi:hypothetical protein